MTTSDPSIDRDSGFTLIEMLISIMITGIILSVLVGAFLVFFTNASYTTARDDHSAGAEILATYMDRDLASATSGTSALGSFSNCTSPRLILQLNWTQYTAGALPDSVPSPGAGTNVYKANYELVADDIVTGRCMVRRTYFSGSTQISQNAVVHDVSSVDLASAATGACGAGSTPIQVTLVRYKSEGTGDYTYRGCLKARTNGL